MHRNETHNWNQEDSGKQRRPVAPDFDLEEQIRQRAYQLFEERGMVDGHDLDEWLQAEQEIKAGQTPRTLKKSATA